MKRFYLCKDPNEKDNESASIYIYATGKSRFFARLTKLDGSIPFASIAYMGITVLFSFRDPSGQEVCPYALRVTDNIDEAIHQDIIRLLQEVAEWYVCHQFGDTSISNMEFGLVQPLSPQLDGFQLLKEEKTGNYLLNFALGAHGFNDLDDALKFMIGLGIDKSIVYRLNQALLYARLP